MIFSRTGALDAGTGAALPAAGESASDELSGGSWAAAKASLSAAFSAAESEVAACEWAAAGIGAGCAGAFFGAFFNAALGALGAAGFFLTGFAIFVILSKNRFAVMIARRGLMPG